MVATLSRFSSTYLLIFILSLTLYSPDSHSQNDEWTEGVTSASQLPDSQKLQLFKDVYGVSVSTLPSYAENFLRFESGIFNPNFPGTDYYLKNGVSISLSPSYQTDASTRYSAKEIDSYGLSDSFSWNGNHSSDQIRDDILTSALNIYFNKSKSQSQWMIHLLSAGYRSDYVEYVADYISKQSVMEKLIDEGPLLAQILPYHMDVIIVGYDFDSFGNLVLEFYSDLGSDWGELEMGKMLWMDFGKFRKPKYDLLIADFALAETAVCSDSDADGICYWGLGAEAPADCPASCDALAGPDCSDTQTLVGAQASCHRNGAPPPPKPDLVVNSVSYNPSNDTITAYFRNAGEGGGGESVKIKFDPSSGGFDFSTNILVPGPGVFSSKSIPRVAMQLSLGQTITVTATIDSENILDEEDETNNSASGSVSIPAPIYPDLSISSIVHDIDSIKVTVANTGDGTCAITHSLRMYIDGAYHQAISVPCPDPGATKVHLFVTSQMGITGPMSKSFTLYADHASNIVEDDESNNSLTQVIDFAVAAKPDLIVDSLVYSGNNYLVLTVKNIGGVRVNYGSSARVDISGTEKTAAIGLLLPSQTKQILFDGADFGNPRGDVSATGSVDIYNNVTEIDETNNSSTATISFPDPKPDLSISSIQFIADKVKVSFSNDGDDVASGFYVAVTAYGQTKTSLVTSLGIGASSSIEYDALDFGITESANYIVSAIVDSTSASTESDETNNSTSSTIWIVGSPTAPDLVVSNVYLSGSYVYVTITNNGNAAAAAPRTSLNRGVITNFYYHTNLNPGASSTASFYKGNMQMVDGSSYDLNACTTTATAELDSTNNCSGASISIPAPAKPDLVVLDLKDEGNYIKATVKNIGTAYSSYSYTKVVQGSYTYTAYTASLSAGVSTTVSFLKSRLGVSSGGTFSFTATADTYNYRSESSETNNTYTESMTLTGSSVDLVVTDVYVSGNYIKVKVKNQGTSSSGYSYTRLYGNSRTKTSYVSSIATGSTYTHTFYKSGFYLTGSSYTFTANADYYGYVTESNESNNSLSKSLSFASSSSVDLIVTNIYVSGSYIKVSVKNQGTSSSGYSYTRLYGNGRSRTSYVSRIAAGATYTHIFYKSDFYLTGSSYSFTANADYYRYVSETNESNNSKAKTLSFASSGGPDLIVQDILVEGNYIKVKVKNQGTGSAGYSYTRLYGNGRSRTSYVSSIAPGATYTHTFYKSDFYLGSSSYSFTANADYYRYVTESNESNNSRSETLSFTTAASSKDLQVQDMWVEGNYIKVKVKNTGTISSGYSYTRLYRSGYSKVLYTSSIGAGSSVTISYSKSDFGVGTSSYAFTATADYYSYVTESSESNNSRNETLSFAVASGGSSGKDLIVQDMYISGQYMYVVIKNQGSSTVTNSYYVKVSWNATSNWIAILQSADVSAGATKTISFYRPNVGGMGTRQFQATADSSNGVVESNETNNTRDEVLSFQ
ncbi:MAG: hypothetical protein HOE90_18420 [Bacteriovoracaceae bacterium]|nr:hypothetical protein [Bacteriovoracaceae bacterium]